MKLSRIDHLVLNVVSIVATCAFYERVVGMEAVIFDGGWKALAFGRQKINLHQHGHEFEPKVFRPIPGSADLCFISQEPIPQVIERLRSCGVEIIDGPVSRTGALGTMTSVYLRDPDMNLIEVAHYPSDTDDPGMTI